MKKDFMTKLTSLGNHVPDSVSPPKVAPIYMNTVYSFDDVETLDAVYANEKQGYVYSRNANPTHDQLSEIMAAIEEGEDSRVYGSGMGAISMAVLANVEAGDHVIADKVLYGGTFQLFNEQLRKFGVETTFLDLENDDIEKHMKPNTKLIYLETITNPLMGVVDIRKVADVAHRHDAIVIVDNTFASPVICQPLNLGADVVVHSATKYICGHSDVTGGVVVANKDMIKKIHNTAAILGPTLSPFDAWILIRSLRTLEIRMKEHSENALKLAEYLEKQPQISKVYYPGLKSSPHHELASEIFMNDMYGGMLSIDLAGGEKAAYEFVRELETIKFLPSLASFSTSLSYPGKTSHRALTEKEREEAGISMGLIRLSIGMENIDDLIKEFDKALKKL